MSLGLFDTSANVFPSSFLPPGCFTMNEDDLIFNGQTGSTEDECSASTPCVCATAPVCSETDGTTANSAGCVCGATICTPTTGLYCHSTYSQCSYSAISACPKSGGVSANSLTCVCGTKTCNSDTGLVCVASQNYCDSTIGVTAYIRRSESCGSVARSASIGTKAECEAAAVSLGTATRVRMYGLR